MIDKIEQIKRQVVIYDSEIAYLNAISEIGKLSQSATNGTVQTYHIGDLLKAIVALDVATDPNFSSSMVEYNLLIRRDYTPKFNMICHIVDRINSVGLHDSTGVSPVTYSYITQLSNYFNINIEDV